MCINQNDIRERSQQVQQMRDVYQQAFEVLIWLGPEFNTTLSALDYMNQIPGWIAKESPPQLLQYQTVSQSLKKAEISRTVRPHLAHLSKLDRSTRVAEILRILPSKSPSFATK